MARSNRTHTRTVGAPDYDDPEFWNVRFASGQDVGEWLNSGEVLLDSVLSNLRSRAALGHGEKEGRTPHVLHLGPGVSQLGMKLRDAYIEQHWKGDAIVNVDFSSEAVRLGQESESQKPPGQAMRWHRVDLLAWDCLSELSHLGPFDVILDKSTSDAIATSTDQTYSASDDMALVCPTIQDCLSETTPITLSPVETLALHLVPLTRTDSTWIVLSYSSIRFDGLPFLARYWTLRSRKPLKAPTGPVSSSAHTPEVFHWLYTLDRKSCASF